MIVSSYVNGQIKYTMQPTILVVEDEAPIREMIRLALELAQFKVLEAENTAQAELRLAETIPNLILLDWMLPGLTGIEYAKQLKRNASLKDIPIIILTAKAEEDSKVKGLEVGADDYVTKPFSPRELIARIKTVLRRGPLVSTEDTVEFNGLLLNVATQAVTLHGKVIELSPLEYRLLHFLMTHPNHVYTRDQLLTRVWGADVYVDERTVDVQIRRLRQVLTQYGDVNPVQTVRGTGYKFVT